MSSPKAPNYSRSKSHEATGGDGRTAEFADIPCSLFSADHRPKPHRITVRSDVADEVIYVGPGLGLDHRALWSTLLRLARYGQVHTTDQVLIYYAGLEETPDGRKLMTSMLCELAQGKFMLVAGGTTYVAPMLSSILWDDVAGTVSVEINMQLVELIEEQVERADYGFFANIFGRPSETAEPKS